jgi:hypothetical protein
VLHLFPFSILLTRFAAFSHRFFVFQERLAHLLADLCPIFHLFASPDAHSQNPLELFWRIKSATAVAKTVGRKEIVNGILPAGGNRNDVINYKLNVNRALFT